MRAFQLSVVCILGYAVVSLLSPAAGIPQSEQPADSNGLLQRVALLEAKIAGLEKKVGELSASVPRSFSPAPNAPYAPQAPEGTAQDAAPTPPGVPPDAERQEFNGRTYYIVPLGARTASAEADCRASTSAKKSMTAAGADK